MEKDFKNLIFERLSEHFYFESEVHGVHFSGKKLRIDHIITPKDTSQWKNKNVSFGIEYKDLERIDGDTKNFTKWLAQCSDYANTSWGDFGYIHVLICPGIYKSQFIKKIDESWLLPRVMAQLGVGELKELDNYGLTITLNDSHRMWSEENGVEEGKRWALERKFGSR